MTTMEYALAYSGLGYSTVPVKQGMKFPTVQWSEYQNRRATTEEITQWFTDEPESNIGIVTGKISGITVVDVDGQEGLVTLDAHNIILPDTYTVRSPNGLHFYYQYQSHPSTVVGLLPKIDIRNDGGMVCAPSSRTPDGTYHVMRDLPLGVLGNTLPAHKKPVLGRSERSDGWLVNLLDNGAVVGERNSDVTRLAGYLWSRNIPEDVMLSLLECWNQARCSPPLDQRELESVIRSVTRYTLKPFTLAV
jgi:hypothetical protein